MFCEGGLSHDDYDDGYDGCGYDYAGTSGAWILLSVKFLFFFFFYYWGFMMRDMEMKEVYDYDCRVLGRISV